MAKYAIGVDFGTLSGRAVLIDAATGAEMASSTYEYPHAVMDETLPSGRALPPDYALQHPQDYIDVFANTIPAVLRDGGVSPDDVIGVGVDFTACTILPVRADGTPLCFEKKYADEPHAYVKLWKHHAAQEHANRLNAAAEKRGEKFLARYGGKISSEWLVPKVWQVLDEAPEIYADADFFLEAADWVVWRLTGVQTRNSCTAGYKAMWHKRDGYPSADFFASLDPRLADLTSTKLGCPVSALGTRAGGITPEMSSLTGLRAGTAVAVGNVDAHVAVPSVGIDGPGKMLAIIGTSTCHMLLGNDEMSVPGICGDVEDGILPGFIGYEAGQSCVGDHFAWFIENCLPAEYYDAAKREGKNIHAYLREKASRLRPGESGLLALDWWNGNRSVLVDVDLTGMMLGMTLLTKPEEIYRALIEATAYGTRKIIENFRAHGVPVEEFFASGGIAQKDPLMMQIYADVIKMPVKIAGAAQGPAYGSAMFGAVAAGKAAGGYDSIIDAARTLGRVRDVVYTPDAAAGAVYDKLYAEYDALHDYFGRGANDVMKRIKNIKKEAIGR